MYIYIYIYTISNEYEIVAVLYSDFVVWWELRGINT